MTQGTFSTYPTHIHMQRREEENLSKRKIRKKKEEGQKGVGEDQACYQLVVSILD